MAKGSGGTRGKMRGGGKLSKEIKDYAKKAMLSNQTEDDIRKFEDKRLMQLIRTGSRYREGLLEEV